MKYLFFLVAVLPFVGNSQSVFPTDMLWKTMSGPSCGYNEYDCRSYYTKITGDTTINEMQYKMVLNSPDTMLSAWSVAGYIREAGQKVFYRHKNVETDCLLYDFGCSEGDTLNLNCWCTDSETRFKVDSIRYLPVIGVNRKHIFLSYFYNSSKPTWIEGIGSTGGLLNSGGPAACYTGFHEGLLCCSKNGEKIYQNSKFADCNIGSLIKPGEKQNYQTIYSNRVALFENDGNRIKALRIDSVKVAVDSVFYPFASIQEVSENCFLPYKASWIGEKLVVKPDGTNLFFNRDGDTIILKTRARVNETWIAFKRADNFRVKATVQSVGLANFLGLTDSVKTISFTVIDQNESTVDHLLNKLKIKISKTYGFVETLNFYLFPDISVRYPPDRLEVFTLVGLTNPKAGIQNLTWFEVNNFQVGDELHVQEHKVGDSYFYLPIREYDNRCIYKYLARINYADSIVYRYARKQSIETVYADSTTLEIFNDTLKAVVLVNPDFNKLPGEPVIDEYSAYQMYMRYDEFRMKITPEITGSYVIGSGNCLGIVTGEGCLYEEQYIEGLGGPYYYCSGYVGDSEERKIVYYKKGDTEWGEKLVITGVSDIKTSDDLKVFPNPAESYITISNPSNIKIKKIEMFDFSGRVVQQWEEHELEGNQLNILHILPGIYLLKAETEDGIKTEKLVVW